MRFRTAFAHQFTLLHRNQIMRLCVYTDLSDMFCSGIVTQVPQQDVTCAHYYQRHELLAFLSGRFNKTQLCWAVLSKEAFSVMATLNRTHWLVADSKGFDLDTDHNNLIYIFDPTFVVSSISQTTVRKVLRGLLNLSIYNYTCIHITRQYNLWADLFGRWSAPLPTVLRLVYIPALSSSSSK